MIPTAGYTPLQASLSSPLHLPRLKISRRHRQAIVTVLATTATPPDSHSTLLKTNTSKTPDVHIRPVSSSDYWAVADMHCNAFYPRATQFWAPLLRLDRVMALQIGKVDTYSRDNYRF